MGKSQPPRRKGENMKPERVNVEKNRQDDVIPIVESEEKEWIKETKNIVFTIFLILIIPFWVPWMLGNFANNICVSEFSQAMLNASKAWVIVTQLIGCYIGVKGYKIVAIAVMIVMPLFLGFVETVVQILNLFPIW